MPSENKTPSHDELVADLVQIKNLVETALSGDRSAPKVSPRKSRTDTKSSGKPTLENHLIAIRDAGFFKSARTADEINDKVQSVYPCDRKRVTTELWRMVKKKQIRKATKLIDGKKQVAYAW